MVVDVVDLNRRATPPKGIPGGRASKEGVRHAGRVGRMAPKEWSQKSSSAERRRFGRESLTNDFGEELGKRGIRRSSPKENLQERSANKRLEATV